MNELDFVLVVNHLYNALPLACSMIKEGARRCIQFMCFICGAYVFLQMKGRQIIDDYLLCLCSILIGSLYQL